MQEFQLLISLSAQEFLGIFHINVNKAELHKDRWLTFSG